MINITLEKKVLSPVVSYGDDSVELMVLETNNSEVIEVSNKSVALDTSIKDAELVTSFTNSASSLFNFEVFNVTGNVITMANNPSDDGYMYSNNLGLILGDVVDVEINITSHGQQFPTCALGTASSTTDTGGNSLVLAAGVNKFTFVCNKSTRQYLWLFVTLISYFSGTVSVKHSLNRIRNGGFTFDGAWTKGSGCIISDNALVCSGAQTDYSVTSGSIVSIDELTDVLVVFTVVSISSGNAKMQLGTVETTVRNSVGTFIERVTLLEDVDTISIVLSEDFVGSVTNLKLYVLEKNNELILPHYRVVEGINNVNTLEVVE